jgi:hypothetical protein
MKFFSDIRLLLLGLWLGAAVFFIGVAQNAFAVLQERELAGAVVGRNLALLYYSGMSIGILLLLMSLVGTARSIRIWLWIERFLLLVVAAACGIGQLVIGTSIGTVRQEIGRPIDELAADDPLREQFNMLHQYSEWVLLTAMIAALIAFFIMANRRFVDPAAAKSDVYDFSKEFKI